MQCAKCKKEMEKQSVYTSGNARYQRYRCTGCWSEKSEALGIVGGMPK